MKKRITILLSAVLVSGSVFSGTHGHIKIQNNSADEFTAKCFNHHDKSIAGTAKVKRNQKIEINVEDTEIICKLSDHHNNVFFKAEFNFEKEFKNYSLTIN